MDERDGLWEAVFDVYYDSYFEELAAENLSRRWQILDEATKVVVAVTTSGSAVAGWALWNLPGWRLLWAVFAGVAALLSITHATLRVPDRVRSLEGVKQAFCTIRIDLETLRDSMRINSTFPVADTHARWEHLRGAYNTAMQQVQNDLLRSKRFLAATQGDLNKRLSDQIREV